jgi:hypothetical protein
VTSPFRGRRAPLRVGAPGQNGSSSNTTAR